MLKILLCTILITLHARKFQTQFKFSLLGRNKGWIYLDKMTFAPGKAEVNIETHTSGLPYGRDNEIFVQAVSQWTWQSQVKDLCNSPVRMPLSVHKITLNGQKTVSQFIFGIDDYQTIYFVLKDCQSRFINDYNNSNLNLHIKLHLLNNDREIGEQEDHWYVIVLIISAGISLVLYYFRESHYLQSADWSKLLLFAGTVTQVSSLCWKSFGYLVYTYTGSDFTFFHYIYLLLHSTSEAAIISLIILIAFGWTLTFNYDKEFQLYVPVVGALGFINIIITMITKIGHSHDRHHVFDSIGGTVLITYRSLVFLIFILGCIKTYRKTRFSLKAFMIKLMILGGLYISSMPVVVIGANHWIHAKNRHEFVFIVIESIKFLTNLILAFEFNYKESQYNKVSYDNSSFIPEEDPRFK